MYGDLNDFESQFFEIYLLKESKSSKFENDGKFENRLPIPIWMILKFDSLIFICLKNFKIWKFEIFVELRIRSSLKKWNASRDLSELENQIFNSSGFSWIL